MNFLYIMGSNKRSTKRQKYLPRVTLQRKQNKQFVQVPVDAWWYQTVMSKILVGNVKGK